MQFIPGQGTQSRGGAGQSRRPGLPGAAGAAAHADGASRSARTGPTTPARQQRVPVPRGWDPARPAHPTQGGERQIQRRGRGNPPERLAWGVRGGRGGCGQDAGRMRGAWARRQQALFINFLLGCVRCHSSEIMEPLHTLLNNSICEESKCISEHSYAS